MKSYAGIPARARLVPLVGLALACLLGCSNQFKAHYEGIRYPRIGASDEVSVLHVQPGENRHGRKLPPVRWIGSSQFTAKEKGITLEQARNTARSFGADYVELTHVDASAPASHRSGWMTPPRSYDDPHSEMMSDSRRQRLEGSEAGGDLIGLVVIGGGFLAGVFDDPGSNQEYLAIFYRSRALDLTTPEDVLIKPQRGTAKALSALDKQLLIACTVPSISPEDVRVLLDQGADVNAPRWDGWTPLICAAWTATDPQVISELLSAGADPEAKDGNKQKAVYYARLNPHIAESREVDELGLMTRSVRSIPRLYQRGNGPYGSGYPGPPPKVNDPFVHQPPPIPNWPPPGGGPQPPPPPSDEEIDASFEKFLEENPELVEEDH